MTDEPPNDERDPNSPVTFAELRAALAVSTSFAQLAALYAVGGFAHRMSGAPENEERALVRKQLREHAAWLEAHYRLSEYANREDKP